MTLQIILYAKSYDIHNKYDIIYAIGYACDIDELQVVYDIIDFQMISYTISYLGFHRHGIACDIIGSDFILAQGSRCWSGDQAFFAPES
jgi:hypothetical protein